MMRAIAIEAYGPVETLREMKLQVLEPGEGEVLVRVHASSVNPLDWKIRSKQVPVNSKTGFPRVLGYDVSGVVVKAGPGVTHVAEGDPVYGFLDYRRDGANAEYVLTRDAFLSKKPETLSHPEAACIPLAALTALQALKLKTNIQEGERLLVLGGSGGVGHFAVQIAKAYGLHVTATCSEKNADMVRGLGADEVIAYDTGEVPDDARFDVIFDTVQTKSFKWAGPHLNSGGRFVGTFPDPGGLLKSKIGKWLGMKTSCHMVMVTPDHHGLRYLAEMVDKGRVKPVVQKVYPITELAEAHRVSADGHVVGKLAIDVAGVFG